MITIGVLALQGAFHEHILRLRRLGVEAREVRLPADLAGLDGLIIPGGESTTIGRLATLYGLIDPLRRFAANRPVWGTCAGLIFMAKEVGRDQPLLNLVDIVVERNAFGSQVASFETGVAMPAIGSPDFPAIFIRAPLIAAATADDVAILGRLADGTAVAARQGDWLVTSFHPELSADDRLHAYFVAMVVAAEQRRFVEMKAAEV